MSPLPSKTTDTTHIGGMKVVTVNIRKGMKRWGAEITTEILERMQEQQVDIMMLQECNVRERDLARLHSACQTYNCVARVGIQGENESCSLVTIVSSRVAANGGRIESTNSYANTCIHGRCLRVTLQFKGAMTLHVVNVYGVASTINSVAEQREQLWKELSTNIKSPKDEEWVIIGGDLNSVPKPTDRLTGKLATIDKIGFAPARRLDGKQTGMIDIFRQLHPSTPAYTHTTVKGSETMSASRIDSFWAPKELVQQCGISGCRLQVGIDYSHVFDFKQAITQVNDKCSLVGSDHRAVVWTIPWCILTKDGNELQQKQRAGVGTEVLRSELLLGKSEDAKAHRAAYHKQCYLQAAEMQKMRNVEKKATPTQQDPEKLAAEYCTEWTRRLKKVQDKGDDPAVLKDGRSTLTAFTKEMGNVLLCAMQNSVGHTITGRKRHRSKARRVETIRVQLLSQLQQMWFVGVGADAKGLPIVPAVMPGKWSGTHEEKKEMWLALQHITHHMERLLKKCYTLRDVGIDMPPPCDTNNWAAWQKWADHCMPIISQSIMAHTESLQNRMNEETRLEAETRSNHFDTKSHSAFVSATKPAATREQTDFYKDNSEQAHKMNDAELKDSVASQLAGRFRNTHKRPPVIEQSYSQNGRKKWRLAKHCKGKSKWRWFWDLYQRKSHCNEGMYDECMVPVDEPEWSAHLASLPNDSAAGPSRLEYIALKQAPDIIREVYRSYINACLRARIISAEGKHGHVVLTPKEAGAGVARSRPLIMLEALALKLVSKLLTRRVMKVLEKYDLLARCNTSPQMGFRPGVGCAENLHILNALMEDAHEHHKELHILLTDIKGAFDSVPHYALSLAYRRFGMPEPLIEMLSDLDAGQTRSVCTPWGLTGQFAVQCGVAQGDCASPMKWNLFMDGMLCMLDKASDPYVMARDGGPDIHRQGNNDIRVNAVSYADDQAQVSTTTAGAREKGTIAHTFLSAHGLELSAPKMQYIVIKWLTFSASLPPVLVMTAPPDLHINVKRTRGPEMVVKGLKGNATARYLGIWFNAALDFTKQNNLLKYRLCAIIKNLEHVKLRLRELRYIISSLFVGASSFPLQLGIAPRSTIQEWTKSMGKIIAQSCDMRPSTITVLTHLTWEQLGHQCPHLLVETKTHMSAELWAHCDEPLLLVGAVRWARVLSAMRMHGGNASWESVGEQRLQLVSVMQSETSPNLNARIIKELHTEGILTFCRANAHLNEQQPFSECPQNTPVFGNCDEVHDCNPLHNAACNTNTCRASWDEHNIRGTTQLVHGEIMQYSQGTEVMITISVMFCPGDGLVCKKMRSPFRDTEHRSLVNGHNCKAGWAVECSNGGMSELRHDMRQPYVREEKLCASGVFMATDGFCPSLLRASLMALSTGLAHNLYHGCANDTITISVADEDTRRIVCVLLEGDVYGTARQRGRKCLRDGLRPAIHFIRILRLRGNRILLSSEEGEKQHKHTQCVNKCNLQGGACSCEQCQDRHVLRGQTCCSLWRDKIQFKLHRTNAIGETQHIRKGVRHTMIRNLGHGFLARERGTRTQRFKPDKASVKQYRGIVQRVNMPSTSRAWRDLPAALYETAVAYECHGLCTPRSFVYGSSRRSVSNKVAMCIVGTQNPEICTLCVMGKIAGTQHIMWECPVSAVIRREYPKTVESALHEWGIDYATFVMLVAGHTRSRDSEQHGGHDDVSTEQAITSGLTRAASTALQLDLQLLREGLLPKRFTTAVAKHYNSKDCTSILCAAATVGVAHLHRLHTNHMTCWAIWVQEVHSSVTRAEFKCFMAEVDKQPSSSPIIRDIDAPCEVEIAFREFAAHPWMFVTHDVMCAMPGCIRGDRHRRCAICGCCSLCHVRQRCVLPSNGRVSDTDPNRGTCSWCATIPPKAVVWGDLCRIDYNIFCKLAIGNAWIMEIVRSHIPCTCKWCDTLLSWRFPATHPLS